MPDNEGDKAEQLEEHGQEAQGAGLEGEEETLLYERPIFPPGYAAGPQDSTRVLAAGGPRAKKAFTVTGQERFEHMLLYCLTLLRQSGSGICAFYIEDFDCGEFSMRVLQQMIGRSGYITRDFLEHPTGKYIGFWAWRSNTTKRD